MKQALATVWPTRPARGAAAALAAVAAGLVAGVVARAEWAGRIAERVAKGKKPRLEDYIYDGQWHAAVVTVGLVMLLAMTARFWAVPAEVRVADQVEGSDGKKNWIGSTVFWVGLLAVLAGAIWLRAPRMSLSLYNDEEYAFRRYVAGEHKRMPDGTREWRPVSWLGTLWGNQMANNGVPYSLLSRACYDWAVRTGRAAATLPAEVPLRVPALLAGIGSIAMIALLARRVGGMAAGLVAAGLAALHPWHVRYSTEARGHSFVLLLAPLLPLALARAVESGRWRWWAVFGAAEVGLLWSFAGSLYYVAAFNFLALVWLWFRGGGVWRTFLAVHVMAAVVYLHLMAPCFPQMRAALEENAVFSTGLGPSWFANAGSFLFAGLPWEKANPELVSHPSLSGVWEEGWGNVFFPLIFCLFALVCGVARGWRSPTGRLIALTLPLAAGLAVAGTLIGRSVLFTWYVLYLLPGGLVLAGVGVASMAKLLARTPERSLSRGDKFFWAGTVLLAVLSWLNLIIAPLKTYRAQGKQALREVAHFVRAPVDGVEPLAALHRTEAIAYDPSLPVIDADVAALQALVRQSDDENRPLLVAFGYRPLVARETPEFLRAIEESGDFERVAHFPGLEEPQFAHHVWRHRPKAGRVE